MLHLYLAAFGTVVSANIVAIIAIAATIKRGPGWGQGTLFSTAAPPELLGLLSQPRPTDQSPGGGWLGSGRQSPVKPHR